MTFKIKDKVLSVMNGEDTDQIGVVTRIDPDGTVYVNPVEAPPYIECRYTSDGKAIDNRPNYTYAIKKLN